MSRAMFLVGFLFLCSASPCFPKNHSPVYQKVLSAKTVYVENHGSAKDLDRAYDELKKWGRWEILQDKVNADLILVLSGQKGQSSTGQTQTYDPTPAPGMGGAGTWKYGTVTSSSPGSVHLEVVDPKTGESLYADTEVVTKRVIKELRKRIEEQEKEGETK